MAQQSIDILKNYLTCDDPAIQTKYFNILDSFWHKTNGDLLLGIIEQDTLIRFEFTGGKSIDVPKPTDPELGIEDITGLIAALESKVNKTPGKGLSTNDFTNTLKDKLDNLVNYTHPASHSMSMIDGLQNALDDKVDKENGKTLTSNDFTDTLLAKLESIERAELHLANKLTQIPGKVADDLGMSGIFDRNALTDADIRGSIDVVINKGNAVVSNEKELLNAEAGFCKLEDITTDANDKFEFDIIIDNGKDVNNYGQAKWQPFLFRKYADGVARCKKIQVFVSDDNSNWFTNNEWEVLNFGQNEFYHFFGNKGPIDPSAISQWRYAKFSFSDYVAGINGSDAEDEISLMQIGIRHRSEKFAQQYLKLRDYLDSDLHLGNYGGIKRISVDYTLKPKDYTISTDDTVRAITLPSNPPEGKLYNFKIGRGIQLDMALYNILDNTVLKSSNATIDDTDSFLVNDNLVIQYSKSEDKWYQVN